MPLSRIARPTIARTAGWLALASLPLLLSACGLAETTAVTASGAQSEVDEANNAKATEDAFRRKLDAAQDAAAAQRAQADAQTSDVAAADPN
ncbi:MAG: hypothetical protein QM718_14920 [Steroidobacteraceae bacterium]